MCTKYSTPSCKKLPGKKAQYTYSCSSRSYRCYHFNNSSPTLHTQLSPASQAVPAGWLTDTGAKRKKKQQGRDAMHTHTPRRRSSSSSSQHDRFTDHRRTDALPRMNNYPPTTPPNKVEMVMIRQINMCSDRDSGSSNDTGHAPCVLPHVLQQPVRRRLFRSSFSPLSLMDLVLVARRRLN
jgi:hypothetical protein